MEKAPDSYSTEVQSYRLKKIQFRGKQVPIITQNENGPCPLLAISNVLLLRGAMQIHLDYAHISSEELLATLSEVLLRQQPAAHAPAVGTTDSPLLSVSDPNREQNVNDAISMFPQLLIGLDVNVKFNAVDGFEFTRELTVFDMFGCNLVHGWLVDPQDQETYKIMKGLSYNQAVERVLLTPIPARHTSSSPATITDTDDDHASNSSNTSNTSNNNESSPVGDATSGAATKPALTEKQLVARFLEDTASQLTYHGLAELHQKVPENELCVFFRNNHFNTLYKHKGALYILATDQGYLHKSQVVWERLDSLDGDTTMVDADFSLYREVEVAVPPPVLADVASIGHSSSADGPLLLAPEDAAAFAAAAAVVSEPATSSSSPLGGDGFAAQDASLSLARQIQAEEDAQLARQLQESLDFQTEEDEEAERRKESRLRSSAKHPQQPKAAGAGSGRLTKSSPANSVAATGKPSKGGKAKKDKDDDGCCIS